MNSLAALPFALLQGVGRSETTAKIHLAEGPLYFVAMIWLIRQYGIAGAAAAWCGRTTLDLALLFWYARRDLRDGVSGWARDISVFATSIPILAVGLFLRSPLQKVILILILLSAFVVLARRWLAKAGQPTFVAQVRERLG